MVAESLCAKLTMYTTNVIADGVLPGVLFTPIITSILINMINYYCICNQLLDQLNTILDRPTLSV